MAKWCLGKKPGFMFSLIRFIMASVFLREFVPIRHPMAPAFSGLRTIPTAFFGLPIF
jgi:hypothetical protein